MYWNFSTYAGVLNMVWNLLNIYFENPATCESFLTFYNIKEHGVVVNAYTPSYWRHEVLTKCQ